MLVCIGFGVVLKVHALSVHGRRQALAANSLVSAGQKQAQVNVIIFSINSSILQLCVRMQ
jgi:hypothetical protein